MTLPFESIATLAAALAERRTTALELTAVALAAIDAPGGQGGTAFMAVNHGYARSQAQAIDAARAGGQRLPRFAGIPLSIKDLFDVAGEVTRAGSCVLGGAAPAVLDAPAVARLRAAGFILIGRTNMTEFAFSGLGLNPHYGTPLSPWRRDEAHIAGGSTSGGAVSVADGMAAAALGTDTGGSCRIPAAWCGLVGWKSTAARLPRGGALPLSRTLDSVGLVARSVACVATLDAILADEADILEPVRLAGLRLLVPTNLFFDGIDPVVHAGFEAALARLERGGAIVTRELLPELDRIATLNHLGGFAAPEAYAAHRARLPVKEAEYDPRVSIRILRGREQSAADYIDLIVGRAALIEDIGHAIADFDLIAAPTVPILPPRLADLGDDSEYARVNLLALRNPAAINMIDGCAISLPVAAADGAPVGLMLASLGGGDRRLLAQARTIEARLAPNEDDG